MVTKHIGQWYYIIELLNFCDRFVILGSTLHC